jgi:YD repeat-containing protein
VAVRLSAAFALPALPIAALAAGAVHAQTYNYDNCGQLTQVQYSNGAKVNYTYDAAGNRAAQTISTASNKAPNTVDGSRTIAKTSQFTIDPRTKDTDPDGQVLSVSLVGMPSCGSVTQSGNNLTFIAAGCNAGPANFTYGIADSVGGTAWGKVNITVTN